MRGLIIVIAATLAIVLAYLLMGWFRFVDPGKPPIESIRATLQLKNKAVANLENQEFLPAIEALRAVIKAVPDDPFGAQNLAVAGVMGIDSFDKARDPEKYQAASEAAEEGILLLDAGSSNKAIGIYLSARRDARLGNSKTAYASYLSAAHRADEMADAASQKAAYWYAAYEVARDNNLEVPSDALFALLTNTLESSPRNLFVLTEALPFAVTAAPKDLPKLISATRLAVKPLRDGMVKRLGVRGDPIALLDDAQAAVDAGNPKDAARPLGVLTRILRPDSRTKSDQRIVLPNLLEFVRLDFEPRFYSNYSFGERPENAISFTEPSPSWTGPATEIVADGIASLLTGDINSDGTIELFAVRPSDTETTISRIASSNSDADFDWSIVIPGSYHSARLVDLDNDFSNTPSSINPQAGDTPCRTTDLDLIVFGDDGITIMRNENQSTSFEQIPDALPNELESISNVAVFDAESDGDLDLLVATENGVSLFLNRGDATFEATTEPIDGGIEVGATLKLIPVDIDRDVDIDVLVLREKDPALAYFENLRHGRLRLRMIDRALGPEVVPTDLALLDADENASWDLLVTSKTSGQLLRSVTPQPGKWSVIESTSVPMSGALLSADFDNDGRVDAISGNGAIYAGLGSAPWFTKAGSTETKVFDNAVSADFDYDGAFDLATVGVATVNTLRNSTSEAGKSIRVTLLAEQISRGQRDASGRVNSYGLGTTVEARFGERFVPHVVSEPTTYIGVGEANEVDSIRLVWPNGIPSHIVSPVSDQYLCEKQTLKGSCPYLYGWDGEKFAFITDLLWAAPVGLRFADGVQATPREWEHLAIPGRLVQPQGDRYELRVTEELWEAAYFDEIKLTAIDHPPGTELITNEKVGPPEIASPRTRAVSDIVSPSSAIAVYSDESTAEFLPQLLSVDGRFAHTYREKYRQGLVEQHAIELTFPESAFAASGSEQTLLLTGWIRPTDTSINVALSHDPRLESPLPPRLLIPNGDDWQVAEPYIGFPGGKTKTIAVDVTGLIDAQQRRLRIETSMEFGWDRMALVTGAGQAFRETSCTLLSANLQERGFSARIAEFNGGPEQYDYQDVTTEPQWPLIEGRFTRLGDVSELLGEADDRLAVIGSGDEIQLSFSAPPPPPTGWVRDFVLSSVGWDKDADLNTIYGDSSEPYPTLGVTQYPEFHDFDSREDSSYQTRRFINAP